MTERISASDLSSLTERFMKGDRMTLRCKLALRKQFADVEDPFAVRLWNGETLRFGHGPPAFTAVFHTARALLNIDEDALADAYFRGDWSIEGDASKAFGMRRHLSRRAPYLQNLRVLLRVLLVSGTKNNAVAVADHYNY